MAITRVKLTGASAGGGPIFLTTAAPATLHTATTGASTSDEVHIWLSNRGSSTVTATVYIGATGANNRVINEVPAFAGLYLTVPGLFLASGLSIYGDAGDATVFAYGFANRLTTGA